jgi:hypothetical protein
MSGRNKHTPQSVASDRHGRLVVVRRVAAGDWRLVRTDTGAVIEFADSRHHATELCAQFQAREDAARAGA